MRVFKEYHVKQNVLGYLTLVDSLDHIYDKMPKLLEQYEWHSWQKISNFSSYNNVQYYCFQSAGIKESGAALAITITSIKNRMLPR